MSEVLPSTARSLPRFGTVLVSGPDAREYLQGQLSLDVTQLTAERIELASCNSAQGRVQAILWLVERPEGILLLLPAELVDTAVTRLRKYVLRAKAKVDSGAGRYLVGGYIADKTESARSHRSTADVSAIEWPSGEGRTLIIAPASTALAHDPGFAANWHLADIRAGLPQVYAATHESFVAQMLNVDLLSGISFEKGCYTGQEIIARAHFRGAVKRRMFAFKANGTPPSPAARILSGESHAGDVVDSVVTHEGCELLAVVSLGEVDNELRLADSGILLQRVPLPYAVPVTK